MEAIIGALVIAWAFISDALTWALDHWQGILIFWIFMIADRMQATLKAIQIDIANLRAGR